MLPWLKSKLRLKTSGATLPAETPIDSLRYVVFDTELTSLDSRSNRLLSLGAIAMDGPKIKLGEHFYRVVNPGVPIPAHTVVIHKLRSEDVQAATPLADTLGGLRRFVEGAVLVGHFVKIDLGILRKEIGSGSHLENPAVDTARVHQWLLRRGPYSEELCVQLDKLDLATLAKCYKVDVQNEHHALSDAFLTAQIWQKMIYVLEERKISNLRSLLRIGGV
jgi:DNA polymerase III subunit epsilon